MRALAPWLFPARRHTMPESPYVPSSAGSTSMTKVLIAPVPLAGVQAPFVDVLRDAGFDLFYHGRPAQLNEEQLLEALAGVDASLAGSEPYTERVLTAHPQ